MPEPESVLFKLRLLAADALDRLHEWRFGIHSGGTDARAHALDPACNGYRATGYRAFRKMMAHVPLRPGDDVFLDIGSGMGRVVLLAATHPFRKVLGVEISNELNAVATENLRRVRRRLKCREVEFHTADARLYAVPPDVTVIYLWNPFFEGVLGPMFENIRQSIEAAPRAVTILYVSPPGSPHLVNLQAQLGWLREKERVPWGTDELVVYACGPEPAGG